nr:hypothetical protein [uncultured Flavobacterium sp.]
MKPIRILMLALILAPACSLAQNKLENSKQELKSNSSSSSSSSSSEGSETSSFIVEEILWPVVEYTVWAVGKYGLFGDYYNENHLYNGLTRYPYEYEEAGNFLRPTDSVGRYVFRIDASDKFLYTTGFMYGNQLDVKVRPHQAFYVKLGYRHLFEKNQVTGRTNDLGMTDISFAYDRVRTERFNLGWSIGYTHIFSGVNKGGINLGMNAEYFLKRRVSFLGAVQWAWVNTQPVNSLELEARWHKKNFFIGAGYEHMKIATPTYNFMTLGAGVSF